jgi:DNA polymerase-3 subunit alpha
MYGAVEFYFAAKKEGLKPILGVEIAIDDEALKIAERPYSLVLLARSYRGYQNLSSIVSFAHKENISRGMPRAKLNKIKEFSEDLICLTGGPFEGYGPSLFESESPEVVEEQILKLKEIFNDQLYLEVFKHEVQGIEKDWLDFSKKLSKKINTPLVLTNDTRFTEREDLVPHNVLIGIGEGKKLEEVERESLINSHFYIKSPASMQELVEEDKDLIEAFQNTLKISNDCDIEFKLNDEEGRPIYHLPQFPTSQGRSSKEEIRAISLEGLKERLDFLEEKSGRKLSDEERKVYYDRLDYELSVIDSMGFNGYFLIVQDFIKWSKNNDVPVGPGRGSGAGSIVAYALKITDLDPIPYSLIFERFLNPERISMPDFDIDFCQEKRGDVINYVTEAYGQESVAQIITYGKLQTRAAIRDVGRVLGFSFMEVNEIAKLIPDVLGITLKESLEKEPRLKEMMSENPQVNKLISLALKVEGLVRHAGIHAAGVIIADGSIVQHAPVTSGADGENVVQYDMKNSEKIGLIKFDFLGLKTLTHIKYALDFIKKTKGRNIREEDILVDDPGIYELMSKGDNHGVFQFEGEGITDLTIKAKPNCFSDIVALNALYRPGPMDMIPDYLERKSGKKAPDYLFPELEEILNETYGIIVYQEHVQLIAAKIANYSLGEADMLRRAMGKKIAEEMAKQKVRFLEGAKANNYDMKKAEKLFDLMAEFAKYGFNKSHAAAYCVITARTAWLKHYYPVEFFAALLSTEITNTDNVVKYVKDAKNHNIEVVSPHVNTSDYLFKTDGQKIFFSLGAIKGVGQSVVENIMEARQKTESGRFESLEEFFTLVDTKRINKKTIESLTKAGALDNLGYNRNEIFSQTHILLEEAERKRKEKESGQFNLFDSLSDEEEHSSGFSVQLERKEEWPLRSLLQLEKEALGFYINQHPLESYMGLRSYFKSKSIASLTEEDNKKEVSIFGLIPKTKEFITKKGTRMAFAEAEDHESSLELVIFPNVFKEVEDMLTEEKPLVITGTYEIQEGKGGKILVDKITDPLTLLRSSRKIVFKIKDPKQEEFEEFFNLAENKQGPTKVEFKLHFSDLSSQVQLEMGRDRAVEIDFEFLDGIGRIFKDYEGLELGV